LLATARRATALVQTIRGVLLLGVTIVAGWRFGVAWAAIAIVIIALSLAVAAGLDLRRQLDAAESSAPSFLAIVGDLNAEPGGQFPGTHRTPFGVEVMWRFSLYVLNRSKVVPLALRFDGEITIRGRDQEQRLLSLFDRLPVQHDDTRLIQNVEFLAPTSQLRGAKWFTASVQDEALLAGGWTLTDGILRITDQLSGESMTVPLPGEGETGTIAISRSRSGHTHAARRPGHGSDDVVDTSG
jgi:hypothetical protein